MPTAARKCWRPSLLEPYALNFPGCATEDDGSCFFPVATCPSDFNLDWLISIQDVLTLLSAFGNTCPGYEVGTAPANCTYEEALNYNADALIDDGTCILKAPAPGMSMAKERSRSATC